MGAGRRRGVVIVSAHAKVRERSALRPWVRSDSGASFKRNAMCPASVKASANRRGDSRRISFMTHSLVPDYANLVLGTREPPCLSLYQPTHRRHPDNVQDPIRFRNLVRQMEESLKQRYPNREIKPLLASFHTLADDREFWNHTLDGLAVFAEPHSFRVYRLQRPVAELAVVADSFHTKPLLRIVQSADRYQILGLNRHSYTMHEGNRDHVDALPPQADEPREIDAMLNIAPENPERNTRTYGTSSPDSLTRHGIDARQNAIDADTERFFRAVDRAVEERHSKPSALPLLLAALPEHHSLFRQVSRNPLLMPEGLTTHPDALSAEALCEQAWSLILPYYLRRLDELLERFGAARTKGESAADVSDIARAAASGRVATLLIEADRIIPGTFDAASGAISRGKLEDPTTDDLLDDIGECVLKAGGEVIIVPAERMPERSGLAAIFRY